MGVPPQRLAKLTVRQVHAMLEAGILADGDPVELIDGLLLHKDRSATGADPMTIGPRHNLAVSLLAALTSELASRDCFMQTQGPITLSPKDEPEPDGAVLRGNPRDYTEALPTAADASCVIEVADSSLEFDRGDKLTAYARAAIPQYLIVNLRDGVLESHEEPDASSGSYCRVSILRAGDQLTLLLPAGELSLNVARLLP